MSKQKVQDHGESQARIFPLPFMGNEVMDSLRGAGEAWMRTCVELQKELASFASARMKTDAEMVGAMARCSNASELAKLQQDWAATAFRDYAKEASQLAQVASDAVANGAAATREAANRAEETIFSGRSAN